VPRACRAGRTESADEVGTLRLGTGGLLLALWPFTILMIPSIAVFWRPRANAAVTEPRAFLVILRRLLLGHLDGARPAPARRSARIERR